jgi:hypothetical protein
VPSYVEGATVSVKGQAGRVAASPGSYIVPSEKWKAGDELDLIRPKSSAFCFERQGASAVYKLIPFNQVVDQRYTI